MAWARHRRRLVEARAQAERARDEARREAESAARRSRLEHASELAARRTAAEAEHEALASELADLEEEVDQAERLLEARLSRIEGERAVAVGRLAACDAWDARVREAGRALEALTGRIRERLLVAADLTEEKVRPLLLGPLEEDLRKEGGRWVARTLEGIESDLDRLAGRVIGIAIGRCQLSHYGDFHPAIVPAAEARMREGLLEDGSPVREVLVETLGAELSWDEEDQVLVVATPDGVKREIARQIVEDLVARAAKAGAKGLPDADGLRDAVAKKTRTMEKKLVKVGKWAARQAHVGHLEPTLLPLLGRLKYRSSYGQNVLYHSIEVAHVTGLLGSEIGLEPLLSRRAGLLHDIGKAVDREREGGHPELGAEILKAAGEHEGVVEAAFGHHLDPATQGIFPVLVGAADAISASRAGARRETGDRYAQRLDYIERMCYEEQGVHVAYCVQGGREVRVLIDADQIDDEKASGLAKRLATRLFEHQQANPFPGQVKVTVIREKRIVEVAR